MVLHRDCHVQFDKSLYSAPFTLVGKTLWLRATDLTVALYEDYRHLCTHLRALRAGQRMTVIDHLPPDARAFFERDRQWCVACHRPRPVAEAYLRLRTLPGEQADVDWAHFGHIVVGRAKRPLMPCRPR